MLFTMMMMMMLLLIDDEDHYISLSSTRGVVSAANNGSFTPSSLCTMPVHAVVTAIHVQGLSVPL